MHRFHSSTHGLEFEHQREVGSVFGKVMLSQAGMQPPSDRLRAAFAFSHFRYQHRHRSILRWAAFPSRA